MTDKNDKRAAQDRRGEVIAKGETMTNAVELTTPPGGLTSIRDGDSWDCPDYFASEAAESGLFYFFYYSDVFVLFVPPSKEGFIAEMATARTLQAAFGYCEKSKQTLWRLVFEDDSLNPFVMTVPFYGLGITSRKRGVIHVRDKDGIRLTRSIIAEAQSSLSRSY